MSGLRIRQGTIGQLPAAHALAALGTAELVSKGLADPRAALWAGQLCLFAEVEEGRDHVPVGVLTFRHDENVSAVYIELSFVLPEFRGRRVYSQMYELLRAFAIDRKCKTIFGGTHVKNTAMRAIAARMRRPETWVMYLDELEPELPELSAK